MILEFSEFGRLLLRGLGGLHGLAVAAGVYGGGEGGYGYMARSAGA